MSEGENPTSSNESFLQRLEDQFFKVQGYASRIYQDYPYHCIAYSVFLLAYILPVIWDLVLFTGRLLVTFRTVQAGIGACMLGSLFYLWFNRLPLYKSISTWFDHSYITYLKYVGFESGNKVSLSDAQDDMTTDGQPVIVTEELEELQSPTESLSQFLTVTKDDLIDLSSYGGLEDKEKSEIKTHQALAIGDKNLGVKSGKHAGEFPQGFLNAAFHGDSLSFGQNPPANNSVTGKTTMQVASAPSLNSSTTKCAQLLQQTVTKITETGVRNVESHKISRTINSGLDEQLIAPVTLLINNKDIPCKPLQAATTSGSIPVAPNAGSHRPPPSKWVTFDVTQSQRDHSMFKDQSNSLTVKTSEGLLDIPTEEKVTYIRYTSPDPDLSSTDSDKLDLISNISGYSTPFSSYPNLLNEDMAMKENLLALDGTSVETYIGAEEQIFMNGLAETITAHKDTKRNKFLAQLQTVFSTAIMSDSDIQEHKGVSQYPSHSWLGSFSVRKNFRWRKCNIILSSIALEISLIDRKGKETILCRSPVNDIALKEVPSGICSRKKSRKRIQVYAAGELLLLLKPANEKENQVLEILLDDIITINRQQNISSSL